MRLYTIQRRNISLMQSTPVAERDITLDAARGVAICAMVAYHLLFDLLYFGVTGLPPFFFYLAYPIAGSFIFIAGISLHLKSGSAERRLDRQGYYRTFLIRGGKILCIAAAITLITWIYPHKGCIVWGILHLIGAATILAIPFLRLGRWNIIPACMIIVIWLIFFPISGPDYLIPLGIHSPVFYTLDYEPLIPWFSLILLGIVYGSFRYQGEAKHKNENSILRHLALFGRHSLIIYLIHQPVIIGILLITGMIVI
ncbi:heparan-alpha-glucosaminide N-acetyltransferase [Methanocalculus sp.]|uniref:heparan-alpha-glucosaminide N-acetyltransferase n=1 Tax=Methanocalculus sp. TaxID=2004547 RepID=UPI002717CA2D|nr:heparan-alpha-glucosaminide N-acetyltransferase [Methanocalculus sp.]MDO8841697.1 heparan-alpha-glucosaminide N-acetyltransferase [Methanocalculus sp.]